MYCLPKSVAIQEAIRLFNENLMEPLNDPSGKHKESDFAF